MPDRSSNSDRGRYYKDRLAAERLKRVYRVASPRVRRYLRAEVDFALRNIRPGGLVLDLGCGYGRTMKAFAGKAGFVVGVDISRPSLDLGRAYLRKAVNCLLLEMDAANLAFLEESFDTVVCIQNGLSAFHRNPATLLRESLRVLRRGGIGLFSTYAEKFWPHRLAWFRRQAAAGLLGAIDERRTKNGVIVCRDGFRAATFSELELLRLASAARTEARLVEVDESSLFCVLKKI